MVGDGMRWDEMGADSADSARCIRLPHGSLPRWTVLDSGVAASVKDQKRRKEKVRRRRTSTQHVRERGEKQMVN